MGEVFKVPDQISPVDNSNPLQSGHTHPYMRLNRADTLLKVDRFTSEEQVSKLAFLTRRTIATIPTYLRADATIPQILKSTSFSVNAQSREIEKISRTRSRVSNSHESLESIKTITIDGNFFANCSHHYLDLLKKENHLIFMVNFPEDKYNSGFLAGLLHAEIGDTTVLIRSYYVSFSDVGKNVTSSLLYALLGHPDIQGKAVLGYITQGVAKDTSLDYSARMKVVFEAYGFVGMGPLLEDSEYKWVNLKKDNTSYSLKLEPFVRFPSEEERKIAQEFLVGRGKSQKSVVKETRTTIESTLTLQDEPIPDSPKLSTDEQPKEGPLAESQNIVTVLAGRITAKLKKVTETLINPFFDDHDDYP